MKKLPLVIIIVAVYALHQDVWNWNEAEPMLFGFLPRGLAYHAAYSVLASALMAVLVAYAWPRRLEEHQR
jgi:hypothetical protein